MTLWNTVIYDLREASQLSIISKRWTSFILGRGRGSRSENQSFLCFIFWNSDWHNTVRGRMRSVMLNFYCLYIYLIVLIYLCISYAYYVVTFSMFYYLMGSAPIFVIWVHRFLSRRCPGFLPLCALLINTPFIYSPTSGLVIISQSFFVSYNPVGNIPQ